MSKRWTNVDGKAYEIPSDITVLEYIQSTGTQYIDSTLLHVDLIVEYTACTTSSSSTSQIFLATSSSANWVGWKNGYPAADTTIDGIDATQFRDYKVTYTDSTIVLEDVLSGSTKSVGNGNKTSTLRYFAWDTSYPSCTKLKKITFKNSSGTLLQALIPAKNSSGTIGMYDLVTKTFFTNSGSGTFTAGPEIAGIDIYKTLDAANEAVIHRELPAEYDELEYLESTGTQYIDTGYAPNQDTSVELKASVNILTENAYYYGGTTVWSGASYGFYFASTSTTYINYNCDTAISWQPDLNKYYHIKQDKNIFYVNDEVIHQATSATFQSTGNLYIGTVITSGHASTHKFKGKLCYFKIWDNSTLVRNFIPAKRKSDSVLGMYDTVTKTFFTNAGSDAFIAGPIVSVPSGYTKLEYIESSGTQYIDTGIMPASTDKIHAIISNKPVASSGDGFIIGSSSAYYGLNIYTSKSVAKWVEFYGTSSNVRFADLVTSDFCILDLTYTTDGTMSGTIDGQSFTSITGITNYPGTSLIYLFKSYRSDHFYYGGKTKYITLYQNDTLVRNFIPARRNSDGEIGMYDTVNDVFYTSSGTGEFIAGPVIQPRKHLNKLAVAYYPVADITGLTTQTGTPTPTAPIYPTSVEPYGLNGIGTYLDKYYANASENLCDGHTLPSSVYGTTVTVHDDGSFTMNGTRISGQSDLYSGSATQKSILLSIIGGSYTIESGANGIRLYNGSTFVTDLNITGTLSYTGIFTDAKLIMNGGTVCTNLHLGVSIVEGSTVPTEYIPYVPAKNILRKIGVKVLDGTESGWGYYEQMNCAYIAMTTVFPDAPLEKAQTDTVCMNSHFARRTSPTTSVQGWYLFNSGYWSSSNRRFAISVEGLSSVSEYTAWLANNPITVYYELENSTIEEADLIVKYLNNIILVNKQ